jgi:alpha-methylacyl-CoA racemase
MGCPLDGIRVVEMAGIGPGPHAAMILADLGADVVRVERRAPTSGLPPGAHHTLRGRRVVQADVKDPDQRDRVRALVQTADVLVEGFRPGVMERLGLGPELFGESNPGLVYARMTGWGQSGPLAATAGHDINYISLTGALHAIGSAEQPVPPLNLVGDFGGGSLFLVTGILAALVARATNGVGQVVDAAMVDGAGVLVQSLLELRSQGLWNDNRSANLLDGAAPYYRTYACRDGGFMAVGAIEPEFYDLLLKLLDLSPEDLPDRDDQALWPELTAVLAEVFGCRTRAEWTAVFDATDACVTPVLTFEEAPDHPHVAARGTLVRGSAGVVAAAAPRFSEVPPGVGVAPGRVDDLGDVLKGWSA